MNSSHSQNLTNEELLKEIEQLKYESRFGCISNSYFRYIIERESIVKPRLLIYADFNDVGKFNEKYGYKKTSFFMKKTLTNVTNYLNNYYQKKVDCVSLGGDEFLFIINDIDMQDISSKIIDDLQNKVFQNSKLSMSIGYAHSQDNEFKKSSIQYALQKAQQMSEHNKHEKNKKKLEGFSLKKRFILSITAYLKAIPIKGLSKTQKDNLLDNIFHIFKGGFPSHYNLDTNLDMMPVSNKEKPNLKNLSPNWKKNKDELLETLNLLGTNPITSGIRKSAFSRLIPIHKNKNFYCSYIDISNLKLSNLLLGHEKTDENIKKIITYIRTCFSQEGINISTNDYFSNPNFIVNLNGCKFAILISEDNINFDLEKLNRLSEKIQADLSDNILGITYSNLQKTYKLNTIQNFDNLLNKLSKKCDKQKMSYRKKRIINPNTSKLWLKKLILELAKDYKNIDNKSFKFEKLFKPNLLSAFNKIPTISDKNKCEFLNPNCFKPNNINYHNWKSSYLFSLDNSYIKIENNVNKKFPYTDIKNR